MTPSELSMASAATTAVDYDPFAGAALARVVPTTESQRELWLASKLEPEASLAYNESISLRLTGELNVVALQAALQQLVDRHEALRATFSGDGEELLIATQQDLPCALRDLTRVGESERKADVAATLHRAVSTPFDLEHGPLVRAELLQLLPDEYLLVFTAHHIVCDGWSFGVIVRDLAALYAQHLGRGNGPAAADPFTDFAVAEANRRHSGNGDADEAYWLTRFAGHAPSLDLPTDRARPRRRSFASLREDRLLSAELVADIKRLGAKRGASLYATLLTAFSILLQRLTGQDDVVIGIPCAGQAGGGHDSLVGHCVNVLPLRASVDPQTAFSAVLNQVRGDLLDAFEHQQYTLGSLLARLSLPRDPGRLPLVSVLFNLDQALDEQSVPFADLQYDFAANARVFENFELFVNAVQVEGGVRLECQYNSDLFRGETVRSWLDAYETLLRSAIAEPEASVAALSLLSDAERSHLATLQPTATPYPVAQLAHEYFEQQADRTPQRMAVRHRTNSLRYAELDARANRLAHCLRERGVGRGSLVGLALSRSIDMVAAVLAVLKAGAGYVPMDPCFPAERLAFMAEDAALAALLVDDSMPTAFSFPAARVLSLQRDSAAIAAAPSTRLPHDERSATPESIAYLIFTSGSTGRPKGVRVPNRTTSNFLTGMQRVPGIREDDRLVAVTTLSFDIAFMELMLPLSTGAEIVLADHDDVRDGASLRTLVESSKATMMQATPAGWRILLESGWKGHAGFRAVSGGEPLAVDLAEALLQRCGEVWNGYGPTETTVYSTYWRVSEPRNGIFIGQPVANTRVYILDELGTPCPLGVPGEMVIGGAGVALGYLNRPELDAERFLPDPFANEPNARMYRTGDRGRWLANGQLEHLGRLDFQVKVRGYRIELGEIESVLADVPQVARAVVMAREDRPGDVRLVAYVVARERTAPDEETLRSSLKDRLPDYMLPQHIMQLDAIPLLPNGKIDRKALPLPPVVSAAADGPRIAPRNDDERRVTGAMETILALPELDVRDDFFALGGHSLLAAQLTARLNREFGVNLSFRTLFDAPTIQALALAIGTLVASGTAPATQPIVARAEQDRAPLSLMQKRLWALEEMQPGRVTYNAPSAHRLRGHLDEPAFDLAFKALMQRQPILRTAFRRNGDSVEQIVEPHVELRLFPAEDLSALPRDQRESALMQRLQALTDTPFELTRAPLFSARMFKLAENDYAFFFMPHHIIWDGWSFDILYAELSQLYRAFVNGQPSPLAPLPVTYGDFATWHTQWLEGPQFQSQLGYWRERLTQMGDIRALPTDQPRRPGMSGVGLTEWIRVSKEDTEAMHEVARVADATVNMTLLSLYYVLLSGVAGRRELVIGTPVRGRNQTEVESIMGYFNNLLPLHVAVDPSLPFVEFVQHVKRTAIDSFGNPDVPLEYLQRELRVGHGTGAVLYQALFSFQDARQRIVDWGGLQHEQILLFQSGATEDLGLWFLESTKGMVGGVTYNADILQAGTARLLRDRYLSMMKRISADPQQPVRALIAISAAELEQERQWNATAMATSAISNILPNIPAMFEAQVDRTPNKAALIFGSWETTYTQIEQRANRLAHCLRKRDIDGRSKVGLVVEPGINRLAGMLAILKTGATCVMLDATDPAARLKEIASDAGITMLLGDSTLELALPWPHAHALWFDADNAEIIAAPAERLIAETTLSTDAVALAVYIADSTGHPRGIGLSHRAVANLLQGLRDALALEDGARILGTAAADSATALIECLLPFAVGGEFVWASPRETADGETLAALIASSHAGTMFAAPGVWQSMVKTGWSGERALKAVCIGGVPSPALATQLVTGCAGLWQVFGSPDSAVAATCGRIERPAEGLHSGAPLTNTSTWILDDQHQPCAIGAIGEICVGGPSLSQHFGAHALQEASDRVSSSAMPGEMLIRTRCRGRWLATGAIQELERIDRRVRIRGRDIDPASIEAQLLVQTDIAHAIAVARESRQGDLRVDAYIVATPGTQLDIPALQGVLAAALPAHEMPQQIWQLDALPLLASGDPDLAALPLPSEQSDEEVTAQATAPKTPNQQLMAKVWCELLGLERVRVSDNFFDIGGHSLLAVDMATRVQRETGVQLNLLDIANSTLGALAAEIDERPVKADKPEKMTSRLRGLFGRH